MLSSFSQKCTQGVESFGQWLMRGRREADMVKMYQERARMMQAESPELPALRESFARVIWRR